MKYAHFAAAIAVAVVANTPVEAQSRTEARTVSVVSTQNMSGDYMTTADGCTYRRTQAPGYGVHWIVVLNPHHIGRPNSPRHCRAIVE